MKSITALVLLILLGVDWASGYAIAGYVIKHGVNAYGYAFWQSIGPFFCLLIIQLIRHDLLATAKLYTFSCAIFGIVIPNLIVYFASKYVDSGILTVLANVAPLFTYPLAIIFSQEKFNPRRLICVVFGVIGVLLIVTPKTKDVNFNNMWLYICLIVPLSYAFSAVYIARFRPKTGSVLNHAFWMLFYSSIIMLPITLLQKGFYPLAMFDINSWLIILEIILSALGYVLLFQIIRSVGPVYYTLVNAIAAFTGVLYAKFLFKQTLNSLTYFAIVLILLAIIGLTLLNHKDK